jgi:8-oxo-dGTP diphosphatase
MMEKINRPQAGVGVMIIRNRKILMGRRLSPLGYHTYGWLGGHIEHGESLKDCATREVLEESGLIVRSLEFLSVNSALIDDRHYIDIEFICTEFDGNPIVKEPEKIESWSWYPLHMELLPKPLFPPCKLALQCYFKGLPFIA